MKDRRPKSGIAEWNITYRCNLACRNCCRFGYLPPTTEDMSIGNAVDFVRQAEAIGWKPSVWIIGGEPTLHPQFLEFVRIAVAFAAVIRVFSNAFTPESREKLIAAESLRPGCVERSTHKLAGSITHLRNDHCIAPVDLGTALRKPCHVHSGFRGGCGISVDATGYSVCPNGGAIDGILNLGARTGRLASLFDLREARRQTELLCGHCGCGWGDCQSVQPDQYREAFGVRMTATWWRAINSLATKKESGH